MIPVTGFGLEITEEVLNGDDEPEGGTVRRYEEGEILYEQGEPGEGFVLVQSGIACMKHRTSGGKVLLLELVGPGELAGLFSAMHEIPQVAIVEAVTDVVVREYSVDDCRALEENFPDWLFRGFSQLGMRTFELWDRQMSGSRGNLEAQLACVLCKLGMKFGEETSEGLYIDFKVTRKRLGELIGARTESVIRAIKSLEKENILASEDSRITIRDLEALLGKTGRECGECFLRTDGLERTEAPKAAEGGV